MHWKKNHESTKCERWSIIYWITVLVRIYYVWVMLYVPPTPHSGKLLWVLVTYWPLLESISTHVINTQTTVLLNFFIYNSKAAHREYGRGAHLFHEHDNGRRTFIQKRKIPQTYLVLRVVYVLTSTCRPQNACIKKHCVNILLSEQSTTLTFSVGHLCAPYRFGHFSLFTYCWICAFHWTAHIHP